MFFYKNAPLFYFLFFATVIALACCAHAFRENRSQKRKTILSIISVVATGAMISLIWWNLTVSQYDQRIRNSVNSLGFAEARSLTYDDCFDIWNPEFKLEFLGQYKSHGIRHILMRTNCGQEYVLHISETEDDKNPFDEEKSVFKLSCNTQEFTETEEATITPQELIDYMRDGIYLRASTLNEDRTIASPGNDIFYAITGVPTEKTYNSVDKLVFVGTYPKAWLSYK